MSKTMLAALLVLAGCASHYQPIIDPQTSQGGNFDRDLEDCRGLAEQQDVGREVGTRTLVGGGVGAALGAIFGAFGGNAGAGAALGAAVGGASGAGSGALQSQQERDRVVRNCMVGRGYRVLN